MRLTNLLAAVLFAQTLAAQHNEEKYYVLDKDWNQRPYKLHIDPATLFFVSIRITCSAWS